MQITILTYGTRGDVEPFIGLAQGLIQSGYSVRLAAPERYRALANQPEIEIIGLEGDPDQLASSMVRQAGASWPRMVQVVSQHILPIAVRVLQQVREACQGTDAIVHSFLMTDAGHQMAVEFGIPEFSAQFFPIYSPTNEFPSVVFPDLPLGPVYRRLTHDLTTATFRYGSRMLYSWLCRSYPGLPRLSRWAFSKEERYKTPLLYAFSRHVIPQPQDWPASSIITGYWFTNSSHSWAPPQELVSFLQRDPPPVYLSFGSMLPDPEDRFLELFAQVLAEIGRSGICSVKGIPPEQPVLQGSLLMTGSLPHDWLFPQVGLAVHHGGAGTTAAVLRAGIPGIVVPFTADQAFWGRRVEALGVSPGPIPWRKLTRARLLAAMQAALSNPVMRQRAHDLGEALHQEDGIANAVAVIRKSL
ncbi:MAG: glycosyltransferase family 1 protein [Anaerolineales bacterium]|nr:glycosyltransferase family 1 protein [Anaerolineales bacterium]